MSELTTTQIISAPLKLSTDMDIYEAIQYLQLPTFFHDLLINYLPTDLLDYEIKKLFRLLVFVCGYLFLRQWYMKHQLIQAKKDANAKEVDGGNVDDLFEKSESEIEAKSTGVKESSWGWGQQTRRDHKKKAEFLQNLQHGNDDSDDEDIKDLLED